MRVGGGNGCWGCGEGGGVGGGAVDTGSHIVCLMSTIGSDHIQVSKNVHIKLIYKSL